MSFEFRDTEVYRQALILQKSLKELLNTAKPDRIITDQLSRAATSVVLNIAEGYGRYHKADKRNFYVTSRASINECIACLDIIFDSQIPETYLAQAELVAKMLSGLFSALA